MEGLERNPPLRQDTESSLSEYLVWRHSCTHSCFSSVLVQELMSCCLSSVPPIEAQWDSIDFYLERKALDPFVDGLEIMTPAVAWDDSVSSMLGLPWDLLKIVCWNNSNCHIHLLQECDGPCLLLLCSKIDFRGYVCMMCISWERLCFGCNSTWRIMHLCQWNTLNTHPHFSVCNQQSLVSISSVSQTWLCCIYYLRINILNPVTFWKAVYLIGDKEGKEPPPWMSLNFLWLNWKAPRNCSPSILLYNLKQRNLLEGWCSVACFDTKHSRRSLFKWAFTTFSPRCEKTCRKLKFCETCEQNLID